MAHRQHDLVCGLSGGGTIGRKLADGADSVRLFGEDITVNAAITQMEGISGHADRDMLLDWLGGMDQPPVTVFVNHGDDTVCDSFAKTVTQRLGIAAVAPYSGDGYDLATGECFQKGIVVRADKKDKGRKQANAVYERLVASGKRINRLIETMKGASNKELSRLADQLDAIYEKYKR